MKKTILVFAIACSLTQLNALNSTNVASPCITPISKIDNGIKITPLVKAISLKDYVMVKKLIELGVDVNEKTNGKTPLMYAARYNQEGIFKLLISNGANIKTKCSQGHDVAYYAKISNASTVAVLLKNSYHYA